jgi:Ca2+-binding EF-hand superfamily protein
MQTRKLAITIAAMLAGAAIGPAALAQSSMSQSNQQQNLQQDMSQQWQKMDANNDGKVSRSEFDQYWTQQFQSADADNNGKLSKQEVKTAADNINSGQQISQIRLDHMFRQADTNHDGSVSRSEDLAYHNKMFRKADTNNDGRLTKTEMRKGLERPSQNVASL